MSIWDEPWDSTHRRMRYAIVFLGMVKRWMRWTASLEVCILQATEKVPPCQPDGS